MVLPKGQLISKANCQAVNSSKKRTNEFVFTTMRCVFVRFLEEIEDSKEAFRNYLTFSPACYPGLGTISLSSTKVSACHVISEIPQNNYKIFPGWPVKPRMTSISNWLSMNQKTNPWISPANKKLTYRMHTQTPRRLIPFSMQTFYPPPHWPYSN